MNFLFNLVKSRIIFFQIFFIIHCFSSALFGHYQEFGLPYARQIRPVNPTGINQFNSIAQDLKGFLYIGGYNGVLRYDGHYWEKILIPGEISVASDSAGIIFAGGDHSFGMISYLQDGSMHFINLLAISQDSIIEFGKVRKIFMKYIHGIWILPQNIQMVVPGLFRMLNRSSLARKSCAFTVPIGRSSSWAISS